MGPESCLVKTRESTVGNFAIFLATFFNLFIFLKETKNLLETLAITQTTNCSAVIVLTEREK